MLKQGIPRHRQISGWVRDQIESGELQADQKLPSENEMAKKFGVSRVTIRRALQTLESDDLIYRCQGIGSFVKDRRTSHGMMKLTDFMEDMAGAGMAATSRVLKNETVAAEGRSAVALDIREGQKVVRLDRLRLADGEPIAMDTTYLPMFYAQLIENFDLETETIYRILEEEYEISVEKGCIRIEAENAGPDLARYLDVIPGAALLRMDRISYTVGDKPVYFQKRYYRPDKIVYELMAERNHAGRGKLHDPLPLKEFVPVFKKNGM